MDCMALSLHYLQMYYSHEIERGKQGLGEYTLHPQFSCVLDLQPPLFSGSTYHPQSIIDRIKGNYTHCENEMNSIATLTSHKCNVPCSNIIENNKVSFDPRLHTFTIMGSTKPHVVTLFIQETCLCPSTSMCYHSKAKYWSRRYVTKRKKFTIHNYERMLEVETKKTSGGKTRGC